MVSTQHEHRRRAALSTCGVWRFSLSVLIVLCLCVTLYTTHQGIAAYSHDSTTLNNENSNVSSTNIHANTNHQDDAPRRPRCDELMARPHSPYADGAFLTRHTTPVQWTPRHDGSMKLEMGADAPCSTLRRYTAAEARTCLAGKHVLLVGDSVTRYLFLSFAYFLHTGNYPPRFAMPRAGEPCTHMDQDGTPACAPPMEPNICMQGDWAAKYGHFQGWNQLFSHLGDKSGVFGGHMECACNHSLSVESEMYASPPDDNSARVVVTVLREDGWNRDVRPMQGFRFSGCAWHGNCSLPVVDTPPPQQQAQAEFFKNKSHVATVVDYTQPLTEALRDGATNGIISQLRPRPDVVLYNRGLWGKLEVDRAQEIFPLLYNLTKPQTGRCFYRSTTAEPPSPKTDVQLPVYERNVLAPLALQHGCGFLDFGHVMAPFASLPFFHPWPPQHGSFTPMEERRNIYWDKVHFVPWVYEELNNLLLNVLCNAHAHQDATA